jgi:Caspase domain
MVSMMRKYGQGEEEEIRALIIGVGEYDRLAQISFCQNDGNGMYEVLRWAGYDIPNYNKLTGYVNWESMRSTTIDFFVDHSISNDDILVFYYSGHGVQDIYGEIYLAPSEIDPDSPYKNGFSFGGAY